MSLAHFAWTDRVRPIVEIGVGDSRIETSGGQWDVAHWDTPGDVWSGVEPTWLDVTCDCFSYSCGYGRARTVDRFVAGTATVVVHNVTGWADPNATEGPGVLTMRPGRPIRMGVVHETLGVRWLFRGFIDVLNPTYDPVEMDTVEFVCIDALGEINRAKLPQLTPAYAGDPVNVRIGRILDAAAWPATKRILAPTGDTLIASDLAGQVADLLGQAADSGGGSVFGDLDANIVYRARDWQTFVPGTPPDATIGNVPNDPNDLTWSLTGSQVVFQGDQLFWHRTDDDVCPVRWERPFARSDMTTRVLIGRDVDTAQLLDDDAAQILYGIEPYERTDLLTESDAVITRLGQRILRIRAASSTPRVRSVSLDARTADNALDLMSTVDVYLPSRYRCRLRYPRGDVFDAEHFATAVSHVVTPDAWTLDLNLDLAAPWAADGGRWDSAMWDQATWFDAVRLRDEAGALLEEITA